MLIRSKFARVFLLGCPSMSGDYIFMRHFVRGSLRFEFAIEKKLFVYDAGVRDGTMDYSKTHLYSGIRATIFGASGRVEAIQATWEGPSLLSWDSPTAALSCP